MSANSGIVYTVPLMRTDEAYALELDRSDPLARFRDRFYIPPGTIYMDGNSLGLLSRDAERTLRRVLEEWRTLGIRGWLEAERPWFTFAEEMGAKAAPLVGAKPGELVFTGTTTVNIHALVSTFYRPEGKRTRILADGLNFPTDLYALQGQVRSRGLDPDREIVRIPSQDGRTLDEARIIEAMTDEIALVFLPTVLYRSGQLLDVERIAAEARRRGIPVGFDASHSAGVVPHRFSAWGVDFAVFCSYKYLNGGPGCSAFLYLNERHFGLRPGLPGWFGYVKKRQFDFVPEFDPARSAGGWQISSPGVLGSSPIEGALAVILEAGIEAIREKSVRITTYLLDLVDALLAGEPYRFSVGTPREPARRGGHVALEHPDEALRICEALKARGVVPDFRPPNIIRIAPVPLTTSFHEVWLVVRHIKEIIDGREYERFGKSRKAVS
jgi:kynureninase